MSFILGIVTGWIILLLLVIPLRKILAYNERRRGGKISWLDYLKIRDLMAAGHNYEAAIFTLKKAYNITEEEAAKMTPERFHELMGNLKTEQAKGGL